jgi:hypothetical protein
MINRHLAPHAALAALLWLHALPAGLAQNVTQTITLQPGWNSVFLEVQPSNNTANAVFAGLSIASAWTRAERLSSAEYIQSASEASFNQPAWLRWFNPTRPEAFLNNLFAVTANRAYLIKVTNSQPVVWSLTGRPSLRQLQWVPDAYTLRGLPVAATNPPTFLNFFRHSSAHFNSASGQLEKIYRLNAAGQWTQVSSNDFTRAGEACWIYTRGASDYHAPLNAVLGLGDGLDYGLDLTELGVQLENLTLAPKIVTVQDVGLNGNRLSYYVFDPVQGGQWPALTSPITLSIGAKTNLTLRLAVRRQDITQSNYVSVLTISDGAGTELDVPVSATKSILAGSGNALAGLWVGTATLDAVSEAHSTDPVTPTPVKSPLGLRLMLHVDAAGHARLLKEVIQMWRNGTYTNNANGDQVVDKPGQFVLLTDDTLIPMFDGAGARDGQPVGRRISTIGYDFPSTSTNNFVMFSGTFGIGQSLTGTLTLPYDAPTNPFKHKYHPDHDNLNPRFDGPAVESYTTTRQIELDFAASPPNGPPSTEFGYNEMGGTYRETITGIHKNPIYVSGTFRLTRLSLIAQLNPSPAP